MTDSIETREFHISDILSVLTELLVSTRNVEGLYDLLGYMTGEPLWTHQLPRAARECEPTLRAQFPDLAAIPAPEGIDSQETLLAWLAPIEQQYGETRQVAPMAKADHTSIDPIAEFKMMRPDGEVMPVVMSDDEGQS
ncbi:hypothetical protein CRM89_00255 [Nocardia sp. FDAARGOS_372]|uniref:DUF7736 domain-containing protein n=1 Tax=Nocardia sp. FDAARGOS_372 TaxID=2018066 RepID=UPI000BEF4D22|nr:hypothetical protein [Nocardia sp. FDAARGOS_372]PEH74619.1 hypothetical protein CRM89_00255 [Nocardia sp. FDAARGOS_372]